MDNNINMDIIKKGKSYDNMDLTTGIRGGISWRSLSHRIHGAAIYGVPWIPSIYPSHVSITSTMDPMWISWDKTGGIIRNRTCRGPRQFFIPPKQNPLGNVLDLLGPRKLDKTRGCI